MNGIINTLQMIQHNWSNIVICIVILFTIINRTVAFFKLSKEERVEAALKIIRKELLKFMSDAEVEWSEFEKAGNLKKSQVINNIYSQFPFLKEYINQDELLSKISDMIEDTMSEMNKIINNIEIEDGEEESSDEE